MKKELNNLKTSDPKEYWKILNRSREKKQADIPMEDLFNFLKNLNTTPDSPTREKNILIRNLWIVVILNGESALCCFWRGYTVLPLSVMMSLPQICHIY
jgi:hypothetical protein